MTTVHLRNRASRLITFMLVIATSFAIVPQALAGNGSSNRRGNVGRAAFVFYQELEVDPYPFFGPTQEAIWRGKGRFVNSRKVYDVEVRLHTTKKFPNTPEPGVITATEMKYRISDNGNVVREVTLEGTVNLNNGRVRLSEQTGRSRAFGFVKSVWTHPDFPTPPVKGPEVICGMLLLR